MANPPPNNPLIPSVTTGAMLPTYVVNRVEVSPPLQQDPNHPQTNIVLSSYFEEAVRSLLGTENREAIEWYDLEQYTSQLRLRIILCNEPSVCQRLDFIQQRLNEYVTGQMGPTNSVAADMLNGLFLAATNNDEIIASLLSSMGPFDAGQLTRHFAETGDRTYNYEDVEMQPVLGKTVVYDIPAVNLLQTDGDGNILRRRTGRTTALADSNGQIIRHKIEEIPAPPISLSLNVEGGDLAQFSVYSFAYFDIFSYTGGEVASIGEGVFTVAESGLGFVAGENFSGQYSVYAPQDRSVFEEADGDTRLVPRGSSSRVVGMLRPQLVPEPAASRMHDFRTYTNATIENLNNRIFENLPRKAGISYVGNKRKVILGDKNYFSDLWLSKDVSEGSRYSFGFGLRGFMINNSRFPWLYQNKQSAIELLEGGSTISRRNSDGVDERTQILDINMVKKLVDFEQFAITNELGTYVRLYDEKLGPYNEEASLPKPTLLPSIYLENDADEKILLYEGRDLLADEKIAQQLSRTRYGVRILIKDSAETYILRHIEMLEAASKRTRGVFEYIVHSPVAVDPDGFPPQGIIETGVGLYDYRTLTTRFPLSRIGFGPNQALTAEEEVSQQIELYLSSLGSFGVVAPAEINDLSHRLKSLMRSKNPQGLQIIADSIDTFAGVLREAVGDSSRRFVGDRRESQQDKLTGRGTYEQKVPLFECEHYFQNFATSGLTFGSGYEYVRQTQNNSQADGLIRISPQDYLDRTVDEFQKYFYFSKDMGVSPEAAAYSPSYDRSSAAFLTPCIIRTYGKELINQPLYRNINGPNTTYDLDRYGELFGDLIKIADKSTYLKGSYYMLEDETEDDPKNNQLYNSVITSLVERHRFNIKFNSLLDVPSLEPPGVTPSDPLGQAQLDGLNLYNIVAGGASDLSFDATSWRENQEKGQETAFSVAMPKGKGPINGVPKGTPQPPRTALPIKLTFSVLGELELDPAYYITPNYMTEEFNSLKNQALSLGLTEQNIKEVLEGDFSSLPNQVKSMFVVAISKEFLSLGPGFEATRNLLDEGAGPLARESKVTAFIEDANLPYSETLDTMKIYSKMLAYWLNYKEICVVEYLRGFEKTSNDLMKTQTSVIIGGQKVDMAMQGQTVIATNPYTAKPKLPVWEKLTPDKLRRGARRNLLCRIRRIVPSDSASRTVKEIESNTGSGLYGLVGADLYDEKQETVSVVTHQVDFQRRELFNLPIYNQYFILGNAGYKTGGGK